jgi:hypothetical protein
LVTGLVTTQMSVVMVRSCRNGDHQNQANHLKKSQKYSAMSGDQYLRMFSFWDDLLGTATGIEETQRLCKLL